MRDPNIFEKILLQRTNMYSQHINLKRYITRRIDGFYDMYLLTSTSGFYEKTRDVSDTSSFPVVESKSIKKNHILDSEK